MMTRLFRLLLLVFVFVGVFQVLVRAQEIVWCVSQVEPPTVRIRETGCGTREQPVSSQMFPSRSVSESYDLTLGTLVGVFGAIIVAVLSHLLQLKRGRERDRLQGEHEYERDRLQREHELMIQGIDVFWRYRKEVFDNPTLHKVMKERKFSTEEDIKIVVDFYEEIGLHVSRNLIDLRLLDEIMGDYIIEAYDSPKVTGWIEKVREEGRDKTYYEHFMAVGKKLSEDAKRRKEDQ